MRDDKEGAYFDSELSASNSHQISTVRLAPSNSITFTHTEKEVGREGGRERESGRERE